MFILKSLKVITISDKSDPNVRFDVFERLNTGGVELTGQEIRACVYRGPFNEFLEERAKFVPFRTVARVPPELQKHGTPEEWVLRFVAVLHGYQKFEHSVVEFLNAYMREANRNADVKELQLICEKTFKRVGVGHSQLPRSCGQAFVLSGQPLGLPTLCSNISSDRSPSGV
jgi:hypothetical protein